MWGKGKVTEFNDAAWDKIMGVNVKSVLWTAKHVVPVMERQGQACCSSPRRWRRLSAFRPMPCTARRRRRWKPWCAAWPRTTPARCGPVVGICPGTIDTPMLAASCEGWDKPVAELYAQVARRIPVRRLGQ